MAVLPCHLPLFGMGIKGRGKICIQWYAKFLLRLQGLQDVGFASRSRGGNGALTKH